METTALHQPVHTNEQTTPPINLAWQERFASVAIGTKLTFSGAYKLFRHPFTSAIKIFAGGYLIQRGITGHCDAYAKLGKLSTEPVNVNIRYNFTVNRPRQEVYDFWRQLENLPLFMTHLDNIQSITDTRSHWEAKVPGGLGNITWEAEIVNDVNGYVIGWQSVPGSTIDNAGKVEFEDAADGQYTIVKVVISYLPPAGGVGMGVAKLLNPIFEKLVRKDVLRFKDYMELTYPNNTMQNDADSIDMIIIEEVSQPEADAIFIVESENNETVEQELANEIDAPPIDNQTDSRATNI
ncbi:DUF2892 domain-containing protein [Mucilaginibacter sp. HMF5004]|uniref:SRPBCC family protein n=1 Tax=Mucilaginibacter rivuli TaxID=2857527 RepID=UPI001C5E633E|nr:SRPBCC family protein [Mucilaginibacter rivuli]MBW4889079.1 DUF2892 domain-containing protein [Mucilaginibacter rivuli]